MKTILPTEYLRKVFPLLQWSRSYDVDKAIGDLVAGITVGLTLIPQSIAYASLAGLEPQYGLYSSLIGGFVYLLFGTIPEINIAPTALLSLLTYTYTKNSSFGNVQAAILLCFLSGIIELICGVLHLGFLVDFVSTPVVAAFTSAGAITIASSQIKNLLGLKFQAETFFYTWKNVFEHITEFSKWDTILGLSCCIVLLLMRKLKDFGVPIVNPKGKPKPPTYKKIIWLLSVSRNALVVVGCAAAAFLLNDNGERPFSLTGPVPAGIPKISFPTFEIERDNKTTTFSEMFFELQTGIVFIPLIAILANVGIAKAFAHGKVIDASQEMIAVGLSNIFGSFFGSYPVNASFSRGAVGGASGVRTPLAGIYSACLVILAFTVLTPYFTYIPKATLAAVIICAVLFMVELMMAKNIWNIYKIDLIPFLVTFIACLWIGIEMGIIIGIFVDVVKVLWLFSRPKITFERVPVDSEMQYLKFLPTSSIIFSSAELIRKTVINESLKKRDNSGIIVMDCERIYTLDFTAAQCLGELVKDIRRNNQDLLFVNIHENLKPTIRYICGEKLLAFNSITELNNYVKEKPEDKCQDVIVGGNNELQNTTKL